MSAPAFQRSNVLTLWTIVLPTWETEAERMSSRPGLSLPSVRVNRCALAVGASTTPIETTNDRTTTNAEERNRAPSAMNTHPSESR